MYLYLKVFHSNVVFCIILKFFSASVHQRERLWCWTFNILKRTGNILLIIRGIYLSRIFVKATFIGNKKYDHFIYFFSNLESFYTFKL